LLVPVSPSISTGSSVSATRSSRVKIRRIATLWPIKPPICSREDSGTSTYSSSMRRRKLLFPIVITEFGARIGVANPNSVEQRAVAASPIAHAHPVAARAQGQVVLADSGVEQQHVAAAAGPDPGVVARDFEHEARVGAGEHFDPELLRAQLEPFALTDQKNCG
jgi:hypothetical protein